MLLECGAVKLQCGVGPPAMGWGWAEYRTALTSPNAGVRAVSAIYDPNFIIIFFSFLANNGIYFKNFSKSHLVHVDTGPVDKCLQRI